MDLLAILARPHPRSALGRALRLPLYLMPDRARLPVLSGINRGYQWIVGSSVAGCWIGTFESGLQQAIAQHVREGMTVYDVGANAGFHTLALARKVGRNGHVFAFEPDAENVTKLRRHLLINRIENVTIVQAAVSDRPDLLPFTSGHGGTGRLSVSGRYLVPVLTLDEFIAKGHPPPTFLKIDVEGAEIAVLNGAKCLLAKRNTVWAMGEYDVPKCIPLFKSMGYSIVIHRSPSDHENAEADFVALPPNYKVAG